mgnify:CR=1 FL=1
MQPPEAIDCYEEFHRLKTQMETFDTLMIIGNRDEINDNEHRLKHFQVKLADIIKETILSLRISIVDDVLFCCVITRYNKTTFITDCKFVDKLLSGEEPMTDKLIQLLKGGNTDERNYNFNG